MCACVGECVSMCLCVLSQCPGMPFLHRPHIIQHSTRGPEAVCKWGVSRRENDNTVSNITGVDPETRVKEGRKYNNCKSLDSLSMCHLLLDP